MPDWDCVNGMASDGFDYDYEVMGPQAATGVGLGDDPGGLGVSVSSSARQPKKVEGKVCISCNGEMKTRMGRYGLFWYCTSGKGCKTIKA